MTAIHPPLFERLTGLLAPFSPAELHGLLCGLLCADRDLEPEQWLIHAREQLTDDAELAEPVRDVLFKLFEYGAAQLNAADWSVAPLLPDDDVPLRQRVDALGSWCQGLLYGLGLGEVERRGELSAESREFLHDATEIARIGFDAGEANEADETAYAEVVEYLRVGLLLIQQDLRHSTPIRLPLH
ncbi:MAG TPA: UPF0149 family protein [Candidatus Competibacter sp.]|nr:UPF0149 family protein [Candidatus Competibacter sp.]